MLFSILYAGLGLRAAVARAQSSSPNIVFIMTDDQDRRLGSTDYQSVLQRELVAKGTEFTNHYTNQALCCPSRSTLLRGQTVRLSYNETLTVQRAHNINLTNVVAPGGSYNKWVLSGQDTNYLPHWLSAAGYRSEYIGKIMNGYGLSNYDVPSKGWDHSDLLVEPYIDDFNLPVLSQNGETLVFYDGFHQTDVIRIKALDRLEYLTTNQSDPFFLAITPFTPHVGYQQDLPSHRPTPQQRHLELFPDAAAPRTPNFNPADEYQANAGGWVKDLIAMNESAINMADFVYRSRVQALAGVDEIIEDVVAKLEEKVIIDNTYIIYTSDNGYHHGQHRTPAGKSLFYNEDTNIPLIVRDPGVPANVTSSIPGLHLDMAPTFLEITGLAEESWPEFFDGRSLLPQWQDPTSSDNAGADAGQGNSKESINIEYWGNAGIEAPSAGVLGSPFVNTTYKTIRMLGAEQSWVYTVWCSGETELYDTAADPYELTNLAAADNTNATEHKALINRLNALLMVTKSCEQNACRDPWSLLSPDGATLTSLTGALDTTYDAWFAGFAVVSFDTCLAVLSDANEAPYYPELSDAVGGVGLGRAYRNATDVIEAAAGVRTIVTAEYYGSEAQRNATFAELTAASRVLTAEEIAAR
ncbi:Uu.00g123270.m01.CDS01 [Anthostomella pinea]|uniref:Uu.00g123270.m01.CDS01 n=1 Tax=Anthostomella pinea TaxID=933095 RepID=A0AAI8YF29_9PEZI|nr:Uu.00g123270.m01.CDS01 [Anthostomella pinea]